MIVVKLSTFLTLFEMASLQRTKQLCFCEAPVHFKLSLENLDHLIDEIIFAYFVTSLYIKTIA
jgi:hypothetical protein